jgi:2'-5' RNA ligase
MKIRYAVWVEVAPEIKEYFKSFPVKNLHLSILWPFFINSGVAEEAILKKIKNISFECFEAKLSKSLVWEQKNKKILVVEVEPKEKFQKIFGEVLLTLRSDILFDKSVFSEGLLPSFLPHITIDYDFKGKIEEINLKESVFKVSEVDLYREEERGKWVRV